MGIQWHPEEMAHYVYDDFRLTLTPRADGSYDALGVGPDGVEHHGTFRLPFEGGELERAVLGVAHHVTRSVVAATRDVGGAGAPAMDAEQLGGALAAALLIGDVAAGYDAARRRAVGDGRGLRLTLSLGAAPALLSVPWELLYRRPTFLANQRQTPVVRHLEVPGLGEPPVVDGTVRILGVVANPADTAPLDVAAERARVEQAVADVVAAGRVTLDWLEPATPRRLREVLRDGTYHVLHYVGHGDFTAAGEGVLYLEAGDDAPDGGHAELDSAELASLLADQTSLRLVVLNACDGARTTLTDPFAGVATTLVQLGVPAVVAMQFAISDAAAILFAEELYTNLIGRQSPIDAAVSEARKAIYIEQGSVEWATPVLFMGDTEVALWRWSTGPSTARPVAAPPTPPIAPTVPSGRDPARRPPADRTGRSRRSLVGALVGVVLLVGVVAGLVAWSAVQPDDDPGVGATDDRSAAGRVAATSLAAVTEPIPTAPTPTAVAPPLPPPTAVTPFTARTIAGSIDAAGQATPTALDLAAGQLLYVHGTTECGPQVAYRLLTPSGTPYGSNPYVCHDLGRVEVDQTGPWSLVVESYGGGTGPYALELTPIRPDTVAPIDDGVAVSGEILDRGEIHRYRFSGAAGESVYVVGSRSAGPCTGIAHQLRTVAGVAVGVEPFACSDIPRQVLPSTGDYELAVYSYAGGRGSFSDTLVRVPPDVVEAVAIGAHVSGEITIPGQAFRYQFAAAAGDALAFDGTGPATTGVAYTVEGPDGRPVGANPFAGGDMSTVAPATGTYTLVVSSWDGGLGAYAISIGRGP